MSSSAAIPTQPIHHSPISRCVSEDTENIAVQVPDRAATDFLPEVSAIVLPHIIPLNSDPMVFCLKGIVRRGSLICRTAETTFDASCIGRVEINRVSCLAFSGRSQLFKVDGCWGDLVLESGVVERFSVAQFYERDVHTSRFRNELSNLSSGGRERVKNSNAGLHRG